MTATRGRVVAVEMFPEWPQGTADARREAECVAQFRRTHRRQGHTVSTTVRIVDCEAVRCWVRVCIAREPFNPAGDDAGARKD